MSVSDMDCSEDEANKTSIEVNVKIPPSMQPRQLKNNMPKINVPRRVSPGRFNPIAAQELATPPQTNMPRLFNSLRLVLYKFVLKLQETMQEVFLFSNVGLIQDRSACQTKIFEWFLVVRYLARGVT